MKPIFQQLGKVLECKLSRIFLGVNMIICTIIFDWKKGFEYFSKINEPNCRPKPGIVNFGVHDCYGGNKELIEILLLLAIYLILLILFLFFVAPSMTVCRVVLEILKFAFPALCNETIDLLTVPVFMVINGIYWILLGCLFEYSHLQITQNRPARKNPLSIYSG